MKGSFWSFAGRQEGIVSYEPRPECIFLNSAEYFCQNRFSNLGPRTLDKYYSFPSMDSSNSSGRCIGSSSSSSSTSSSSISSSSTTNTSPSQSKQAEICEGDAVWCISEYDGYEGYPPWPARVQNLQGTQASIHFFGDESMDTVDTSDLREFLPYFASIRRQNHHCEEKDARKWENAVIQGLELAVSNTSAGKALQNIRTRGFAKLMQKAEEILTPLLDFTPLEYTSNSNDSSRNVSSSGKRKQYWSEAETNCLRKELNDFNKSKRPRHWRPPRPSWDAVAKSMQVRMHSMARAVIYRLVWRLNGAWYATSLISTYTWFVVHCYGMLETGTLNSY